MQAPNFGQVSVRGAWRPKQYLPVRAMAFRPAYLVDGLRLNTLIDMVFLLFYINVLKRTPCLRFDNIGRHKLLSESN
jgi:hypothetical protein